MLNARLWAWLDQIYHARPHYGLEGQSPIERWRNDLPNVRKLTSAMADRIDDIFYHQTQRVVRKDGTISWEGRSFEVHHNLVGESVTLIFNPHTEQAIRIETVFGDDLGPVVLSNLEGNLHRTRQRPHAAPKSALKQEEHAVDLVYEDYVQLLSIATCEDN